jgi:hypothetical protein
LAVDEGAALSESPPSSPTNAAPDWAVQTTDIHCPLCEYNLRGLIESRCPECGHRFQWQVLLDARQHQHPYLFEHHPERNVRSFFRTLRGGLRPRKFWTELKPVQPVRGRRLMIYWILIALTGMAAQLAGSLTLIAIQEYGFSGLYGWAPFQWSQILQSWYDYCEPLAYALAMPLTWPWISLLSLMVFQISMRRAGIRKNHVVRCVVYSSDFMVWSGAAMLIWAAPELARVLSSHPADAAFGDPILGGLWISLLACLLMAYRLYIAYKKYLAFDKPLATVIASQLITGMIMLIAILYSH